MIYEYKCDSCGKLKERFCSIKDYKWPEYCECGSHMTKVISGGLGTIFKGEWPGEQIRKSHGNAPNKKSI